METVTNLINATRFKMSELEAKFNAVQSFTKTYYKKTVNLWVKDDKARLYVPRNAYEQAGYIDLYTGEIFPTRPGNYDTLKEALEIIKK